jgi:hypothetical protein
MALHEDRAQQCVNLELALRTLKHALVEKGALFSVGKGL